MNSPDNRHPMGCCWRTGARLALVTVLAASCRAVRRRWGKRARLPQEPQDGGHGVASATIGSRSRKALSM